MGGFLRHSSTSCSSIFMVTTMYHVLYFYVKDIHTFHFHFFRHSFIHLQFKCFHGRQCTYCVHGVSMCPIYGRGQVQSLQPKTFSLQMQLVLRSGRLFWRSPLVQIQCRQLSNLLGLLFEYPLRCSVVSTWPTCRGHLYKQSPKEEGG